MATRLNTKFILILAVSLMGAGTVVGGLVVLQIRGDATRHIRAGDSLMAEGQAAIAAGDNTLGQKLFENALKQYGRAVRKEPAELSHLRKLESALASLRPETQDRASELDGMRLEAMRHEIRYRPQSAESHLKLIHELYTVSRMFNRPDDWEMLADAADDMYKNVQDEPQHDLALLYRGMGKMRAMGLAGMGVIPRDTGTPDQIKSAEADLDDFVAKPAFAHDDLGWAVLAESRLSRARQLRVEGGNAEAEFERADEALRQALEAVPNGPEVARVAAMRLALQRVMDQQVVASDELNTAIDRMEALAQESDDPLLLADVAEVLRSADFENGRERAIALMGRYVSAHPEKLYQRLQYAQLCYMARDRKPAYLDDASSAAETIIATDPLPVGTLSRIQNAMRIRAAGLLVDIAYRQWINADDADKPDQLGALVKARDRLAGYVAEPENDPTLVNADGKIAVANDDYATAAAKFERALDLSAVRDFDTLWNAARCLDQIGQYGRACDRFTEASQLRPGNVVVLNEKVRLEYKTGSYDSARATAQQLLQIDPDNEQASRVLTAIASVEPAAGPAQPADEASTALHDAQEALTESDLDTARNTLVDALPKATDKLPLLSELVRVEVLAGRNDEAVKWIDQVLEIQPNNELFRRYRASLSTEDQIEALKQFNKEKYPEESQQVVHTCIELATLARQLDTAADRQEKVIHNDAEAKRLRDRAESARNESERYLVRARKLAPDDPALIDHLFNEALIADDEPTLDALVEQAKTTNADHANGLIYQGRLQIHRDQFENAVQSLTDATTRIDYSALAFRMLGRAYQRLGNFTEALRAYEQAFKCNPADRMVLRWYIELLIRTGDQTRALSVARAARRTVPGDSILQDLRLQLEAVAGDLPMAIQERRMIYERNPDDRTNAVRLVALLSKSKPTFEHLLGPGGMPQYDARSWAVLPERQRAELLAGLARQWRDESDRIIRGLEAQSGDILEITTLRAEALRARGEVRAGEQQYLDYCDRHPDDLQGLLHLGDFQARADRIAAAAATFQKASALQTEAREADLAMADLRFDQNDWEAAKALYRDLADDGAGRDVLLRLTECHLKLKEYDASAAALDRAVAAGGPDVTTALLAAGIADGHGDQLAAQGDQDAAKRQYAKAEKALDEAESLAPGSPMPHIRRAQRLVSEYGRTGNEALLDDAMVQLGRADELDSGNEDVSRVRVAIYRIRGDQRGAIGELTRLLKRRPDSVPARRLLVQLYAQAGNQDMAMATINDAIGMNPTIAVWHEAKGDLLVLLSKVPDAIGEFRQAYQLEPSGGRLAKYAETALALPPDKRDYSGVAETVEAREDLVEGRPLLRSLYARALSGVGRYDAALDQMRTGYDEIRELADSGSVGRASHVNWLRSLESVMANRDPAEYEQFVMDLTDGDPAPVELLWISRFWVTSGPDGLSRGIEVLRRGLDACPDDDPSLRAQMELDLGQFLVMTDDYRGAAEAFERVLEVEPDNILALNNAAFIYLENLKDYDKALGYAEQAAAKLPDVKSPQDQQIVLDTLGWVYYRVGRYEEAEDYLRRSIKAQPTADNHCHLAYVLYETAKTMDPQPGAKRLGTARTYLSRAAELGPSPTVANEINQLAEQIRLLSSQFGRAGAR